ncbi:MAG: hypothetical protein Q8O34_16670 [Rhodocyclaceae bacterium]|nr:hypothetical protein [Rhodocyclaceae bacterium]
MLDSLKARMAALPGVATCKIGLEDAIAPEDYPILRLVPSRASRGEAERRKMDVLIYFGAPILAVEEGGVEAVYRALFALEGAIIAALSPGDGWRAKYVKTITDEDRIETYKLMVVRCEVEG